ncbi:helix-turn-helix domain-containing protein [Nocardia kruczakiae]|uniref:helix-turn-helix domain-containing protein n=1 Tax=Nocardia kruczakiae TaxID=261477 RepID=UPI0035B547F6
MSRFEVLRPHIEDGVPLIRAAGQAGVAARTAQRWLQRYRTAGLAGLAPARRRAGGRRTDPEVTYGISRFLAGGRRRIRRTPPAVSEPLTATDLGRGPVSRFCNRLWRRCCRLTDSIRCGEEKPWRLPR